jgi:SNF2 family DNA or RNA helicase
MATAELDESKPGWIAIDCLFRDKDLIRAVPGARQILGELRRWRVPLSWTSCLALRGIFEDRLEVGPLLAAWAYDEIETRINPVMAARADALDPAAWENGEFGYQPPATRFLVLSGGAILGDDMGTGKTVTVIRALEDIGDSAYPCLVVALRVGKRVWARHYAKWAPNRTVTVVDSTGSKKTRQLAAKTDVVITNYESLRGASRLAHYGSCRLTDKEKLPGLLNRHWGAVVADEAHKAKDPHSKQTRALWGVGQTADLRIAATGTPGGPADMWSLLHFVAPDEWPSKSTFIDRYCEVTYGWHGGTEIKGFRDDTRAEFWAAAEPRYIRRPKELVLPKLPPKVYETRWVEMGVKQAKAYKEMKERQVAELDGGITGAFNGLTKLTRLSQFASAFAELVEDGEDEDGRLKFKVLLSEPSSKCDDTEEFIDEMAGRPVGIYAESLQLINLLAIRLDKAGIKYGRITGDDNDKQRDQAQEDFINGEITVMLLTIGAGGASIDLTTAGTGYFMQRSFSHMNDKQAEDRFHRAGQKADSVLLVDGIAPGTVEETVVFPTLGEKSDLYDEVTRDRALLRRLIG